MHDEDAKNESDENSGAGGNDESGTPDPGNARSRFSQRKSTLRINTNLGELTKFDGLSAENESLAKSLEKLSSGLRINRANDEEASSYGPRRVYVGYDRQGHSAIWPRDDDGLLVDF